MLYIYSAINRIASFLYSCTAFADSLERTLSYFPGFYLQGCCFGPLRHLLFLLFVDTCAMYIYSEMRLRSYLHYSGIYLPKNVHIFTRKHEISKRFVYLSNIVNKHQWLPVFQQRAPCFVGIVQAFKSNTTCSGELCKIVATSSPAYMHARPKTPTSTFRAV